MKKALAIIVLINALFLAAVAGWFSVTGMAAVFSGSMIGAAIMMGSIETGKLSTAAWLKVNWEVAPKWITLTGLGLVIVLMLVTSMGIFGYLSKAHIEQGAGVGNHVAKIERLDERIAREETKITNSQNMLDQLDAEVNTLIKYDKISRADGSKATRESQRDERESLNQTIDDAEKNITNWSDEKFAMSQDVRAYEVEIGPIKYVADMLYGDEAKNMLDEAVRVLIIILIFVFDPLAIWMLIAANHSLMQLSRAKKVNTPPEDVQVVTVSDEPIEEENDSDAIDELPDVETKTDVEESNGESPGVPPIKVRRT